MNRQLGVISHAMTGERCAFMIAITERLIRPRPWIEVTSIVIAVELANQRDHGFRDGFTIDPFTETLVGLRVTGNTFHM